MIQLPCVSGGSNSRGPPSSEPRVTCALASARGHSSGGTCSHVSPGVHAAGGMCLPGLGGSWLEGSGGERGPAFRPGRYGRAEQGVARGGWGPGRLGVPYAAMCSTRLRLPRVLHGPFGLGRPGVHGRRGRWLEPPRRRPGA